MPFKLTLPRGVAGSGDTSCPRSRDGLPDRDDVPDDGRQVSAQWVRPRGPRLHPPSGGTGLVALIGTEPTSQGRAGWRL